jgi:hypothetical protein
MREEVARGRRRGRLGRRIETVSCLGFFLLSSF